MQTSGLVLLWIQPALACVEQSEIGGCVRQKTWKEDCTRDAHSIGAQIPQPQYAAAIGHNNDLHIVTGPVAHDFVEAALVPEC